MKKLILSILVLLSFTSLTACELFGGGNTDKTVKYETELESSTGKWYLLDENKAPTSTYFEFDGGKDVMSFNYVEDGSNKYQGNFTFVYHQNTGKNATTLSINLFRDGESKVDTIYAYADDFETSFTQFTTIREEREEDTNDGRLYAHIYRIGELPYQMGTYVLENNSYKQEKNEYRYASYYQIPEGQYSLDENTSFTFLMPKVYSYALFSYQNDNEVVEGVYWTAEDKKTIYLYIEHDPYQYIRREDRDSYDMTFSHDYPPDFYLRGNFDASNGAIKIDSLYHHEYSPTKIQDSVWKFGTFTRN